MTRPIGPAAAPGIDVRVHGDFVDWLAALHGTIAVTTYNSGKLALVSAPGEQLTLAVAKLARPMGVAFAGRRLAVAAREEIIEFQTSDGKRFSQSAVHRTGRLDVHELAYDARGLCFANTRCNCLARPSARAHFRRMWDPPFIVRRVLRDCCHLNGLGIVAGRVELATAFGVADEPGGWRSANRFAGGVAIDVRRGRLVASGLCMPHSPRWDGHRWWLCNSGQGAVGALDPSDGVFCARAVLPGFTRGLCFAGGRAVVGLSRIRREHILDAPPVRAQFPRMRSGLWLIAPDTGRTTGALEFVRGGREVFDVAFLPGITRPTLTLGPTRPPAP